jgi:hypothetical protein
MNDATEKLFKIIFQEAHVLDFDFSKWDKRIRLVVVAGLTPENFNAARGPLHNVDFLDVAELIWKANHLDVVLDNPEAHCQWVIEVFDLETERSFYRIALSGFGPSPALTIICRDIAISEMSPSVVDQVNPDWNNPYRPLARLGFQELLARIQGLIPDRVAPGGRVARPERQ